MHIIRCISASRRAPPRTAAAGLHCLAAPSRRPAHANPAAGAHTLPATEMTSPALTSELGLQPDRQFTRTSPGNKYGVGQEQRLAVLAR